MKVEVNIRDNTATPQPEDPQKKLFLTALKIFLILWLITYLTSDSQGLPTLADVVETTWHMAKRLLELFQMILQLFGSENTTGNTAQ